MSSSQPLGSGKKNKRMPKSSSSSLAAAGGGGAAVSSSSKNYYTAKGRAIAGAKGLYVTCVRGKEQRCIGEVYELLDQVADQIYPPERLQELNKLRAHRYQDPAESTAGATAEAQTEEDGLSGPSEGSDQEAASEEQGEEDESIEATIARELAELKQDHEQKHKGSGAKRRDRLAPKDQSKPKGPKPRFVSVQTNTECLCFFATAWPYDPVEITQAIVAQTQKTGLSQTRYTQRLSPIVASCHALNIEQVEADSRAYLEKTFTEYWRKTGKTDLTYYIDTTIRCHVQPITRDWLLATLGAIVRDLANPSSTASTEPHDDKTAEEPTESSTTVKTTTTAASSDPQRLRPVLNVSVSSANADLVLLPTVLRNSYGLSVVEGKLWNGKSGRRFNIEQVAAEARRRIEQEAAGEVKKLEEEVVVVAAAQVV